MFRELFPLKRYPFLDGFRAYAIVWIVLHHINTFFNLEPLLGNMFIPFYMFADIGFLGVDIFFVISGFLIAGLLLPDLDEKIRIKHFYIRRAFKILPPYLLAVFVGMILLKFMSPVMVETRQLISYHNGMARWHSLSLNSHRNIESLPSYFFLAQNYTKPLGLLAHMWAVAIETHFYILFPFLLIFIVRWFPKERRLAALTLTLVTLIALDHAVRYVNLQFIGDVPFLQSTHFRMDALLFGCLLKVLEPRILKFNKNFLKLISPLCALSGLTILISFNLSGFPKLSWFSYSLAYLMAGLFLVANLTHCPGMNYLTANKFATWLGRHSYGIYLWHYILLFVFAKYSSPKINWVTLAFYLGVTILAGVLTTYGVEHRLLKSRNRLAP